MNAPLVCSRKAVVGVLLRSPIWEKLPINYIFKYWLYINNFDELFLGQRTNGRICPQIFDPSNIEAVKFVVHCLCVLFKQSYFFIKLNDFLFCIEERSWITHSTAKAQRIYLIWHKTSFENRIFEVALHINKRKTLCRNWNFH